MKLYSTVIGRITYRYEEFVSEYQAFGAPLSKIFSASSIFVNMLVTIPESEVYGPFT
ncbi:MAG: hypothetical protein LBT47_04020 [Deltaproteobacteria bacterium]|jgi:hypothetical protein|nr:hypothetical protein [Deltaproteobacteria bacterium]